MRATSALPLPSLSPRRPPGWTAGPFVVKLDAPPPVRSASSPYTSGSFDLIAAISQERFCISSGSDAGYKLPTLPKHAVFGEHALVLPPDDCPTQKASGPGSILAPSPPATR